MQLLRTLTCPSDRAFGIYVIDPLDLWSMAGRSACPVGPLNTLETSVFNQLWCAPKWSVLAPQERQVGNSIEDKHSGGVESATHCEPVC